MDLRHLRSLIAVIDHGGLRTAAAAEHIAQPAITRHLQALERDLGVTLFERSGRGVKPTPTARQLYDTTKPHLIALDQAAAAIRVGASATLRIGYIAPAITELVPRLVDTVRALAPGIQIELHTLTNPDLLDRISNGTIDIGFALATDNATPGTLATPIAHLHYLLAVSLDDALAATNPAPLSALADRTIVTPATREPTHQRMVDHVRAHADRVAVQDAFTLDAVLSLVGARVGVAFVPAELLTTPPPGIALLDTEPPLPTATLTLVRPARHSRLLRSITDHFLAQ